MTPARGGLQAERTSLAWSRTTLSLLGNGGLLLVRDPLGRPVGPLLAVLALVLAAGSALFARSRARRLAMTPHDSGSGLPIAVLGLAVAALALAVGCAVLAS